MNKVFKLLSRKENKKRATKFMAIILGCAFLVLGGGLAYQAVALDGINITAPMAGEYWSGTQLIRWEANCEDGDYINIQYTTGSTFITLATIACDQKQYEWHTDDYSDNQNYQIRLYLDGNLSKNDISDIFTIDNTSPSINSNALTYPNGGEYLAGGEGITITWDTTAISDTNLADNPITLEYYDGNNWIEIASEEANDGSYDWTVPSLDIDTAKIRITAVDKAGNIASDESDDVFTIDSTDPEVGVITPNGGEMLRGGTYEITWQASDDNLADNPINIEYCENESCEEIASGEINDGSYDWTVPNDINTNIAKIKIIAVDKVGNSASDKSDDVFIIDNIVPNSAAVLADYYGNDESGVVHLSGTASDDNAGIDYVKIVIRKSSELVYWDGNEWQSDIVMLDASFNEGEWTYNLDNSALNDGSAYIVIPFSWDRASNSAMGVVDVLTYDSSAPKFTIIDDASADWVDSDDVVFTVNYDVSGNSDVHNYVFIDDDDFCNSETDFSGVVNFEASGDTITVDSEDKTGKYLCLRAGDTVGHIAYQAIGPFKIDNQPASITISDDAEGEYQTSDEIAFEINYDPSEAGDTQYTLTNTATCDASAFVGDYFDYTSGQVLTFDNENDDGLYVCLRARDAKGDQDEEEFTYALSGQLKIDTTVPEVTIDEVDALTNQTTQTITGTYIEDHLESITVNGMEATIYTDDNTYSAEIDLNEGDNAVTVIATDEAGNTGEATTNIFLDTIKPTVDITSEEPDPTNSSLFSITITFSEEVSNFELDDIIVDNGTVSNLATIDNKVYTADITPSADGEVTVDINNEGAAQDSAGNDNEVAGQFSITYDKTAPSFTIVKGTDAGPVQTDTIRVIVNEDNGIAESKYAFSSDNTCDNTDNYIYDFESGVNFDITDDHTDHLCVMATDEAGNTGYVLVGPLNTDNTPPAFTINEGTDEVPVKIDIINITVNDLNNIAKSKYGFSEDDVCDNADNYDINFESGVNFDIADDYTDYLCVKAMDEAGNIGYQLVGQLNTDNTAPTLINVSISSNNTNNSNLAKVDDIITLTFTASEALQTPSVTIAGNEASVAGAEDAWTATYVMQESDNEGEVMFNIAYQDLAGNSGTAVTNTSNGGSVFFDRTAPTLTKVTLVPSPTNDNTPDYTFSTNESGTITYDGPCVGDKTEVDLAGNVTVVFNELADDTYNDCVITVTDATGNSGELSVNEFTIDTQAPATTDNAPADWQKEDVTVTLSPTDSTSGVDKTYYCVDQSNSCTPTTEGTSVTVSAEGTNYIRYYSIDKAGNNEDVKSVTVLIDKTTPVTTDDTPADWQTEPFDITLSPSDDNLSPVATYYTIDGSDPDTNSAQGTTIHITEDGIYTIKYFSIDEAGNQEPVQTAVNQAKLDTQAPTSYSIAIDQEYINQTNQTVMSFTFTNAEMDANYYYTVSSSNGEETVSGNGVITADNQQVNNIDVSTLDDGTLTLTVYLVDQAGNQGDDVVATVMKDVVAPEISNLNPHGVVNYTNPTINADFSDITSDVDISELDIQVTGGSIVFDNSYFTISPSGIISNTSGVNFDKNTTYTVMINNLKDSAGNITSIDWSFTISSNATEVDIVAPTVFNWTPSDNSIDVPVDVQPIITFSEPMDTSTLTYGNIELRKYDDNTPVSASINIDSDNQITIIPDSDLEYNTQYYFFISTGVKDLVGNSFVANTWYAGQKSQHEFTTETEPNSICNEDYTSCAIPLKSGWNLISLPLIPNNSNIENVLAGLSEEGSVDVVQYYDNGSGEWLSYAVVDGIGDLTTMEDGKGYWVYANQDTTLTINGRETNEPPATPVNTYEVGSGWNLLGFKSVENMTALDYTNNQIGENDLMWGYKNNDYKLICPVTSGDSNVMEPGFGYWLYVSGSGYDITPPTN